MLVEYMCHSGSDLLVVDCARASFGKQSKWEEVECTEATQGGSTWTELMLSDKDTKLINYLAREKHVLPFRHPTVTLRCKAPLFVARQLMKHQVGMCLTGDTMVTFVKVCNGMSNGTRETSMEDLYRMWSGQIKYQGGEKGKRNVSNAHVRVFNEETSRFETSHIVDVLSSGKKDVYEITTADGLTVKASADHDMLTIEGWKKLKDLECGDYLVSDRKGESYGHTLPPERGKDRFARRKFWEQSNKTCVKCSSIDEIQVSHILPVWKEPKLACDFSNMEILCRDCHVIKDSMERKCVSNLLPKATEIVSIDYVGNVETYDLSIDAVHNFVANGLVVHNSWSEESRRYITTEPEFYWPEIWREKADNVKQGSSDEEFVGADEDNPLTLVEEMLSWYNRMIEQGMAPEQARMLLPQNMMTTWVWTGTLLAWIHMLQLRLDAHTQKESRDFAALVRDIIQPLYPVSYKALMKESNGTN